MGKKETTDATNEELEVVDIKEESEVKETVKEKPLIVNEKETKPAEKFEKPKDTSGMIKTKLYFL